ncbi:MAG: stalk domain-containing protein, partial [Armatimonadota bacterium]
AMDLMKQAHEMENSGNYKDAIDIWKQAIALHPKLYAHYPDDNVNLHATTGLANAYYYSGDYKNALPAFELAQQYVEEFDKCGESILPWYIAECRKKLAEDGEPATQPLVIIGNRLTKNESISVKGTLLVPVSEAARLLHLKVTNDVTSKTIILSESGDMAKVISITAMSKIAIVDSIQLVLPVAPIRQGSETLIPIRVIAEYFGYTVKWDPMPRVAWVSQM